MPTPCKRRILFFIPSLCGGGAERVFLTILNNLDRDRFEPWLAVLRREGAYFRLLREDVKVVDLQCSLWSCLPKIVQCIRTVKPATVFSTLHFLNKMVGFARMAFLGQPIRFIVREETQPSLRKLAEPHPFNADIFYRVTYGLCDAVVCQSDDMLEDVHTTFSVPRAKLHKINNPIDVRRIEKQAGQSIDLGAGRINLLAAGRLVPCKGFDLLLAAVALVNGTAFHLHILGEGPEESRLKQQARALGIAPRVTFHGFQANPYKFMHNADAFVLSSRYEGFPNVMIEAMSCGCPTVAARCKGGVNEIVQEGVNGFTVEPNQPKLLAEAIRGAPYQRLDRAAVRESVRSRYDLSIILPQYEAML